MPKAGSQKYLLTLIFISFLIVGLAQNRKDLQKLIRKNKQEIDLTKEILEKTRSQKVVSLQQLSVFQKQIQQRKDLIGSLSTEIDLLNAEIDVVRGEISAITAELNQMKAQFGSLIRDGYKSYKNQSELSFIFSASDFNDVIKRVKYLNKLLEYRKMQLALIEKKQLENTNKIQALLRKKSSKLSLLNNREYEQSKLVQDEQKEEELIASLKKKESELIADLKRRQKQAEVLSQMVEEEIAKNENSSTKDVETEKSVVPMNGTFLSNRGKLPWPVKSGYISEQFGVHKHNELKNIQTENNGINIATKNEAIIYPVFTGTVSAIMDVPGMKRSVLLKHDGYYSVYANLEDVFIQRGDEVQPKTQLGRVVHNEDGLAILHLEIWQKTQKQDPEIWLIRR